MRISDGSSDVCSSDLMPFGVTLAAPGFCDAALEPIAERLQYEAAGGMGRVRDASLPTPAAPEAPAVEPRLNIAVVGAHLSGMEVGRASCRESVCQYVVIPVCAVSYKNNISIKL